jgi:hypothetical protein
MPCSASRLLASPGGEAVVGRQLLQIEAGGQHAVDLGGAGRQVVEVLAERRELEPQWWAIGGRQRRGGRALADGVT